MNQLKEDIINWKKHIVWVESYEIPNIVNKVLSFHNAEHGQIKCLEKL